MPSTTFTLTHGKAQNFLNAVGLPQLYFDQMNVMNGHIANAIQNFVNKAVTGPKYHRRLQNDWAQWQAAEWIQLDNYEK
jgi:hypothetical protein